VEVALSAVDRRATAQLYPVEAEVSVAGHLAVAAQVAEVALEVAAPVRRLT
jgi:hypothetical protein